MSNEQTPGQIYKLIPLIMHDVGHIGKERKNQAQNYAFRGIDDVLNALQPPLVKYGVFVVPQVLDRSVVERASKNGGVLFYTTLRVRFTLYAPDGSSIVAETVGEAMDSGDKSSNKAMSAAMKYAMIEIFCIATEEQADADYGSPEVQPQKEPAKPSAPAEQSQHDAPAPDLKDNKAFRLAVANALRGRGFATDQMQRAVDKLRANFKAKELKDIPAARRQEVIDGILEGKADKYKAAAPENAAA